MTPPVDPDTLGLPAGTDSSGAATSPDPFGTVALRRAVLDGWAASPARFREDANAEEALALGGYAGRALVELASNGVDAAREAGVPACVAVRLAGGELRVANTGAELTRSGVAALASLRASAKRESTGSVGRFGVGFTAVLSWSDRPTVQSRSGGVTFDSRRTAAAIRDLKASPLDREVMARGGAVPILRLPWPSGTVEPPPHGYTTEVRLPLRAAVLDEVTRLLADRDTAEDLLWALPDLETLTLNERTYRRTVQLDGTVVIDDGIASRSFRVVRRTGHLDRRLLADQPIEQRRRAHWRITWALPESDSAPEALSAPVGSPVPTADLISLPARLIGTFPVEENRRSLASGPLLDHLLDHAVECYQDLIAATPPAHRWKLLPATGFPLGHVDSQLRDGILRRFAGLPLLVTAAGDEVTAGQACMLPGLSPAAAPLLGQAVAGLLPPAPAAARTVLAAVGVRTITLAEASGAMGSLRREPRFWHRVYEALATAERPPDAEDLADLPVPLAGGRRSLGARGTLIPPVVASWTQTTGDWFERAAHVIPRLRIVDRGAVHPLLERLGAHPATPQAVLSDPAVVDTMRELREALDVGDPDPAAVIELGEVILDLVVAGARSDQQLADELVLTDDSGQPWPAAELYLPDGPLAQVLAADTDLAPIASRWVSRYPREALTAAGVRDGFAIRTVVEQDPDSIDVPDWNSWLRYRDDLRHRDDSAHRDDAGDDIGLDGIGDDGSGVIADLDQVDPDRWAEALAVLAEDRSARDLLAARPAAALAGGRLDYSGWWLSRHARVDGRPLRHWRIPDASDLQGLYDVLPLDLDTGFACAVGVRGGLPAALRDDPQDVLDRLADPHRPIHPAQVGPITSAVVEVLGPDHDLDLPQGVRVLSGAVVDAGRAVVLDSPWWAQVIRVDRLVPGGAIPEAVARALDLPRASRTPVEVLDGPSGAETGDGVDGTARERLGAAANALGVQIAGVDIRVRPGLRVSVDGGEPIAVTWWGATAADEIWVNGSAEAAGRAVAWSSGRWPHRHLAIAAARGSAVEIAEESIR